MTDVTCGTISASWCIFSVATAAKDSDSSVEMDCLSTNVIKPYMLEMYHNSKNYVVSEPGRFSVETACGTAAIDIGIGRLQNIEW